MTTLDSVAILVRFVNCHLPHSNSKDAKTSSADTHVEFARPGEDAHTGHSFGRYQPGAPNAGISAAVTDQHREDDAGERVNPDISAAGHVAVAIATLREHC